MGEMSNQQGIKSITWEAVVTRADGSKEDLGQISHWQQEETKGHRLFKKRVKKNG